RSGSDPPCQQTTRHNHITPTDLTRGAARRAAKIAPLRLSKRRASVDTRGSQPWQPIPAAQQRANGDSSCTVPPSTATATNRCM
ncbi:hypothetical protein BC831DRAFT_448195, partial [Entophlyctis helioformis]